ncbi:MAG TPA: hypothetical protein VMS96_00850 [Terriglobales bacterium]|nr:hypothetical protein [Terriglobales bacterium]
MVLLVGSFGRIPECGEAIRRLTGEAVGWARDLGQGMDELRRAEFAAVVVDQHLWDMEPRLADSAVQACGTAVLVLISPAVSSAERVAREVSGALRRREGELRRARADAEASLRTELNEAVTGILLSSELALASPGMPGAAANKIRSVYELAMSIRERLEAKT